MIVLGDTMNTFFMEQVHRCVGEFYTLYNTDDYISKRRYDTFLDTYTDIIQIMDKYKLEDEAYKKFVMIIKYGYQIIEQKNRQYVEKHLKEDKQYFDSMFENIDKNIILDEEQRKAILVDEDYSLIIAGAGSGKTTTMAAKIKYLIEKKKVNPNEIILLSFTNKSVEDLDELLNQKFHLNVEVLTFHKLGMKFLRGVINQPIQIIGDGKMSAVLKEYMTKFVFPNKELLEEYLTYFKDSLFLDENCIKFDSYDTYYEDSIDRKYEMCKENLGEEIQRRIRARSRYLKTINGEFVKSEGELNIANRLYTGGIPYQYELVYPHRVKGGRSYSPDFTIFNLESPVYIEYFGYATMRTDGTYTSDIPSYEEEIGLKRENHERNKTDLIELYGKYENKYTYLSFLYPELAKRNIYPHPRTKKEIFYRLLETSKDYPYIRFIKLCKVFIHLFKEKNYSKEEFQKIEEDCEDITIKNQLRLLRKVYVYYQKRIHEQYKIDFQDMIHYAYEKMEIYQHKRKYLNYAYVMIDEYQDISYQRYQFIKKISDLFSSKIIAVGDDWQAIYSFSGADIDLFTNFCEMLGYGEQVQITKTYRNSQELIDVAGDFVSKNNKQIAKYLVSEKHLRKPIKVVEYDYNEKEDNLPEVLEKLIIKIYEKYPNDNILLLSRYNDELENLLDSKLFIKWYGDKDKIHCKAVLEAEIDFLTIHKSKGLGYDRVILLNGIDGTYGFPSQLKDEPVIEYMKGENNVLEDIRDTIEFPEERRLFYVALTRTKNELFIMSPSLMKYKSDFIKEIENHENVTFLNI